MASLYQSTSRSRKIIFSVLIVLVGILFVDTFVRFSNQRQNLVTGEPSFYMSATRDFGNIDRIEIPSLDYNENARFVLESVFNSFPDTAYVYSIEKPRSTFSTFDNALVTVGVLGFNPEAYTELTANQIYRWDKNNELTTIVFDKENLTWDMESQFSSNSRVFQNTSVTLDINGYASRSKSLINDLGFDSLGFPEGIADIRYITLGLDGLFLESDQDAASFVYVNIFRNLPLSDLKPSDQQPTLKEGETVPEAVEGVVYSEDPRFGQISMIVSNDLGSFNEDVFKLEFTDFKYGVSSAYQIITPEEAWNEIQSGSGSLVLIQPQNANHFGEYQTLDVTEFRADARRTEIAYYEPKEWTGYVYPIYIFRGTAVLEDGRLASFTFFVDAIKRAE